MEFLIASMIVFNPTIFSAENRSELVVWNIGQGLWTTLIEPKKCFHFDAGGEFFDPRNIQKTCHNKKNYLYLSHWDWDHIRFISKLKRLMPNLCVEAPPEGTTEAYKEKMLKEIPRCKDWQNEVEQIQFPHAVDASDGENFLEPQKHQQKSHRKNRSTKRPGAKKPAASKTNELSNIFVARNEFLLPGDSTSQMEKIWAPMIRSQRIKTVVLAHHGSKTSTSEEFLENVPNVTLAIASARKKRYGHPHLPTVERLHEHGIPILSTEDWGNIHVEE